MASPSWSFAIDWNGDGDYTDTGESVTSRVLDRGGLQVQYGRDDAKTISTTGPGQASFTLNNRSRDYSPDYASSPLAGLLGPGRSVRIQATHNATTYDVFRGVLDDYTVLPDRQERAVQFSCVDAISRLAQIPVSTELYPALRTDQAIGILLDAAGWSSTARDLDPGSTIARWWWAESTDAWSAIQDLVNSEGPGSFAAADPNGNFVFRSRHHRLTRSASTTSQVTLRDSGAEPRFSELSYDAGWRDIVNSIVISVGVREPGPVGVVWSSDSVYSIADGETLVVRAEASDPFTAAVTPEQDTDYAAIGSVSVVLTRTSGSTTDIRITASGGPASIIGLQLRGAPVPVTRTVQVTTSDGTSIAKYGRKGWGGSAPWAGVWDSIAIGDLLLASRADRLPTVVVTLKGGNDTRLVQQFTRDLADRLTIIETETGLNSAFYLQRIEHDASQGGRYLETRFFCEKAPTQPTSALVLGTGVLNTNTLGAVGLDDPATALVLGTSVLNTGRLAT